MTKLDCLPWNGVAKPLLDLTWWVASVSAHILEITCRLHHPACIPGPDHQFILVRLIDCKNLSGSLVSP